MSPRLGWAALACSTLLLLAGGYALARLQRYSITVGGGGTSRYYSVIKLDRWTGAAWRLDNSGLRWNRIEETP